MAKIYESVGMKEMMRQKIKEIEIRSSRRKSYWVNII